MSTKPHFANKTLHLLVAVLILLTSVPMSTSVVAAPAVADDAVAADAPVEKPVQKKRLEPGVRLYAVCAPPAVAPGAQAACTVTVLNEDDEDVSGLKLSARLPKGLSLVGGQGRWNVTVEELPMGESVASELALEVGEDAAGSLSFEVVARGRFGGARAKTTAIVGVSTDGSTDGSTDERIAADGGLFVGNDGRVRVHFPPGALKKGAKVKARVHKQGIDPRGRVKDKDGKTSKGSGALLRFSLEAEDVATGETIHQFDAPVKLEIDLRGLMTKEGLLLGQSLYLLHIVDPETGEAEEVPFEYDEETEVMTAELAHFSDFVAGVMESGQWKPALTLPVTDKFSGSASYHYPIATPAGRNGLQPNLTISYNSRRLDGLLGGQSKDGTPLPTGWSVGGLPEVVRSIDWDGGKYTAKDHFTLSLNGASHKLLPDHEEQTCGRYWVENAPAIYVERRNNSPDCQNGSTENGLSDYWIARTPDGTEYRFGYTHNSMVHFYDPSQDLTRSICHGYCYGSDGYKGESDTKYGAYRWRVDVVTGTLSVNDRMAFTYGKKKIEPKYRIETWLSRPETIEYNYDGVAYLSQVQFVYKYEVHETHKDGYLRMLGIRVLDNAELIREYGIGRAWRRVYKDEDEEYCDSWITNIQEIGRDGTALPAETFVYTNTLNNAPGGRYPYSRLSAVNTRYGGRVEIDYESDGRHVSGSHEFGYSYRVSEMRTQDGVHDPQYGKVTYEYGTACYDQTDGAYGRTCKSSPDAEESGPLVGHDWVKATVWDYDGAMLGHSVNDYYICPDNDPGNCADWKIGRELLAQTYTAPDQVTLLTEVETTWNSKPFGNDGDHSYDFGYQQWITTTDHSSTEPISTKVGYDYAVAQQSPAGDVQYGNVTHVREYGSGTTPYRTTVTEYNPNANTSVWIVGTPKEVKVYEGDVGGTLLTWSQSYYDYSDNLTTPPALGLLTKAKQIDPRGEIADIVTCYTYNAWGNVTEVRDALDKPTYIDYDTEYHMYPVRAENAAGHWRRVEYYGINATITRGLFAIGDDTAASGGRYIHVPTGEGNRSAPDEAQKITFTFKNVAAGQYKIKGWVYAAHGDDDSFFVKVDGGPAGGYLWDTLINTAYQADYVSHRGDVVAGYAHRQHLPTGGWNAAGQDRTGAVGRLAADVDAGSGERYGERGAWTDRAGVG